MNLLIKITQSSALATGTTQKHSFITYLFKSLLYENQLDENKSVDL